MNKQQYDLVLNKLRAGEVVAIPTETVYGLAVDALNHEAIQRLYQIKNRNPLKPTSIAIKDPEDITTWTKCTDDALKLVKKFWPGSLTLILPSNQKIPKAINLINESIGVRCSCSSMVKEIITMLGNPICLTSANLSGNREAVIAKQVRSEFGDAMFVLEDDKKISGVPSTILDLTIKPYLMVREGTISFMELNSVLPGLIARKINPSKNF